MAKGAPKAGKARVSKPKAEASNNPFEVRTNKRKYDILGQKRKHERGLPGISRSKAIQKRKGTLLVEYKQRKKANVLLDRRFGEADEQLTVEEKMLRRFTVEKQRHHERSKMFNLEDEELTHLGQSLGDVEAFDDVRLSDDEDDQGDEEDVKELHFGGFLSKKNPSKDTDHEEEPKHKSRKEIMEEVVAKAKLKKHERQVLKEETSNLTEKLDEDWKSVAALLSKRVMNSKPEEKTKADDYDKTVRELAFEIRGKATDRLKTEEELAKQEQENLKKLEADRIRRMKGIPEKREEVRHISADDLGDSFTPKTDERKMLSYQDGKIADTDDVSDDESGNDPEEESEEEDEDQEEEEEMEGEDEDLGELGEEGFDDEETDDSSDEETAHENGAGHGQDEEEEEEAASDEETEMRPTTQQSQQECRAEDADGKIKAARELPYTFQAPKSYAAFKKLLKGWTFEEQLKIIERIKACNHPKISPGNKSKMEVFFSILLEFVGDLATQGTPGIQMIDKITRHVFEVAQHSPGHTSTCVQNLLKTVQQTFVAESDKRGGRGAFSGLRELLYLKLVAAIFPTSDFKHGVCTPAMVFMAQILSQSPVRSLTDVIRGLFICNLFYEFLSLSKRFVPEVINFLSGVLFLASTKTDAAVPLVPPFKAGNKWCDLLALKSEKTARSVEVAPFKLAESLSSDSLQEDDSTRVNALRLGLHLLLKFAELYQELPSFQEVFSPVRTNLQRIPVDLYPAPVKDLHSLLLTKIDSRQNLPRRGLTMQARKPQPIKSFEPKFEEHYEIRPRRTAGSKRVNELQKLRYKHKKETKGAIREIRKDAQFLAKHKLQEQLDRDAERSRRVKEIEHMLSNQQGEANELNRRKRKLK